MIGQCALCRQNAELQDSHYMPKSLYRVISKGHDPADSAPILIDIPGQSALRTNLQFRKYLLCSACEGLFDRNGENVVIPQCAQGDGRFRLLDAMMSGTPTDTHNGKVIFKGPTMPPGVDGSAYQYFAASIFWRGSVTRWPGQAASSFGSLGSRNEDALRQYLLGQSEFPHEARILVFVDFQDATRGLMYFPTKARDEMLGHKVFRHSFLIPGVRFYLIFGRALKGFPDVGTSSTHRITMFQWHPEGTEFRQGLLNQMQGVQPKGALAKQ
jgi:hypothetical protein